MSQYRQATFIEGVRVLEPMTVGPVYVEPLPDVSLGRALVSELAAALERLGFVTPLDVPAVRASISGPRPASVLLISGEAESFVQMTGLFAANVRLVRDVLTLICGGASRLLCQVLEHRTDGGEWLPLGVTNGGPGWQRSEIPALAPDGFVLADLDPTETYESLAQRPVVAFWVQLFTSAISEQRWTFGSFASGRYWRRSPSASSQQVSTSRICIGRLLWDLREGEVDELVIESRQERNDRRDRRTIVAAQKAHRARADLSYRHERPASAPMLWLPDIVAGAVAAHLTTTGEDPLGRLRVSVIDVNV